MVPESAMLKIALDIMLVYLEEVKGI